MDKSLRRAQRGASLVELMVGMAVALVTVLAITQVMVASEAYKRTTTGGSDAQQNGAYSGLMLERYIRMGSSNFATIANAFGLPAQCLPGGRIGDGNERCHAGQRRLSRAVQERDRLQSSALAGHCQAGGTSLIRSS